MSTTPTTVLSTIPSTPEAPAPPAEPETPEATPSTPSAAETPAETPQEPKPDPDLEIAKKLDLIARREAKARRQEVELQTLKQSLSSQQEELKRKLAELDAALEDPIEYHLKKGKDPVEVAKRFAKPMTEEEKRIAKLEAKLAEDEENRKKESEAAEKRHAEAQKAHVMRTFVSGILPDEYPHITSVYEPHQIPGLVQQLLNRPHDPTDPESPTLLEAFETRYGRRPTDKEIRDALEHDAEIYATRVFESVSKRRQTTTSQATPETPPASADSAKQSAKAPEESTSLSNQHAASSSSARVGTESREERMRRLKEELEAEAPATE